MGVSKFIQTRKVAIAHGKHCEFACEFSIGVDESFLRVDKKGVARQISQISPPTVYLVFAMFIWKHHDDVDNDDDDDDDDHLACVCGNELKIEKIFKTG